MAVPDYTTDLTDITLDGGIFDVLGGGRVTIGETDESGVSTEPFIKLTPMSEIYRKKAVREDMELIELVVVLIEGGVI